MRDVARSDVMTGRAARGHQLAACVFGLLLLLGWVLTAQALFAGFSPAENAIEQAQSANGALVEQPSLHALVLTDGEKIEVDGRLNDGPWMRATSGCGFRQWDPARGTPASEQTIFKVAYDDDALYFAIACLEQDPAQVAKCLSRRDQMNNSDNVSIYIDPYHDRSSGYNFRVNPLGVQEDRYVFNDGDMDSDWDAVWEAETYEDEDGWYAEMRIPFSSIRYRQDSPTWGLQVYRYMHRRGEDTAWVVWNRDTAGFVSRFGVLDGMNGIPAPRQLEILPYAVARSSDFAVEGPEEIDQFQNFGMDLKYGVSAALTLNATVQPDFGQVEADPATLNLSPYETFYQEKRPFFVEGSRFFQHPGFNMFYSRRIGTGDENARIRYAAKLTGKTSSDLTVGVLMASTDITTEGQTHNFLKEGSCAAHYIVGRIGKEYNEGNQKLHVMQTAVVRTASRDECGNLASREAYTTGFDFETLFRDRSWAVEGSVVGSIIDPEPLASDPTYRPENSYGTGGILEITKRGGKLRGNVWGNWETGRLDLNDIGYLSSPDELGAGCWLGYRISPDSEGGLINQGNVNFNYNEKFLYEPRAAYDLHTGQQIWSYKRGHRAMGGGNINGWMQFRNYWEGWYGVAVNPEGTQRWDTRTTVALESGGRATIPGGGPLIDEPLTWGGWLGIGSDSRKSWGYSLEGNYYDDAVGNASYYVAPGANWSPSAALRFATSLSYQDRLDDTQHLENYENPGGGIGGVSYVYGDLHQKIFSMTLRSSVLFSRKVSFELYARPYLTVGDYRRARELARPDSYDLQPYEADGFDVNDWDFSYAAVNLNAVFRWEYRPGSRLYLVWTHGRESYDTRASADGPGGFNPRMDTGSLFQNEPENVFLVKISYWIPI